jgi:hypothetical protein
MPLVTLLDMAVQQAADDVAPLIDEASLAIPEIQVIGGEPIQGTSYKTLVRTALPVVKFRQANQGVQPTKATYINRLVQTFAVNPRWSCDILVARDHPRGEDGALADAGIDMLEAALQHVARQLYYGNGAGGNDADGFPGFVDVVDPDMEVDATGAVGADKTSVWAVRIGMADTKLVYGNLGSFDLEDPRKESVDDANGDPYTAWVQELLTHVGLQVASITSIGRIKNLTAEAGKMLDDDLVADLLEKFPAGKKPTALFMGSRSIGQLRRSRTATNATGAPAPYPTEAHGIPIHETDGLVIGGLEDV